MRKSQSSKSVFGIRLREARLRADIPQDKLGVSIGLDETTASARISRYETGVHEPAFDTSLLLAQALDVPAAYFYCDSDDLARWVLAWHKLDDESRRRLMRLVEDPSELPPL
jgi:transcriptional regulator with XRE-family HTH domain